MLHGNAACSFSCFSNVWRSWSPRALRIREKNQQGRCDLCAMYTEYRRKATTDVSRRDITQNYMTHLKDQYADRTVYARICSLSETATGSWSRDLRDRTASVLSVCIDGMDQSKFKTPRNVSSSKLWDTAWRPVLHFTGVLVHGVGEYYYIGDSNMRKDSNANIELLSRTLDLVVDELLLKGVQVPQHLALRSDNTCREQKNRWGLLWLAWLT